MSICCGLQPRPFDSESKPHVCIVFLLCQNLIGKVFISEENQTDFSLFNSDISTYQFYICQPVSMLIFLYVSERGELILKSPFQRQQLLNERVEMRVHVRNRELTVLSNTPHNVVCNLSKDTDSSSVNSPSSNNVQ